MSSMHVLLAVGVVAGAALATSSASATWYSSRADFETAYTGASTIGFAELTTSLTFPGQPWLHGNVVFEGNYLAVVSPNFWEAPVDHLIDDTFGGFIRATFSATTAFGAFLSQGYQESTGPLTLSAYNGDALVATETVTAPGLHELGFLGLDGVGQITSFRSPSRGPSSSPYRAA